MMAGSGSDVASIAVLQTQVSHLTDQVETLTEAVNKLAEVDLALRLLIRGIKWLAGLAAAIAGVWAAWRGL